MEIILQTLSIIGTILGSAYFIHRDITLDMKAQSARSDRLLTHNMEVICCF